MLNTEKSVKDMRRNTRRKFSSVEKLRMVLDGLRGECSIAELCRREGINANLYYRWSEDFIDVKRIAIASVSSFESAGINRTKLDAPKTDSFSGYSDAAFGKEIFDIALTEIESVIEPNGIGNHMWRESVTLISIQAPILPISAS
jgi:transposase-like protein